MDSVWLPKAGIVALFTEIELPSIVVDWNVVDTASSVVLSVVGTKTEPDVLMVDTQIQW